MLCKMQMQQCASAHSPSSLLQWTCELSDAHIFELMQVQASVAATAANSLHNKVFWRSCPYGAVWLLVHTTAHQQLSDCQSHCLTSCSGAAVQNRCPVESLSGGNGRMPAGYAGEGRSTAAVLSLPTALPPRWASSSAIAGIGGHAFP